MATKLPYVLPFEDGSVVAAILLKAQGLPDAGQIATKTELQQATAYLATLDNATMAPQSATVKRETDNLQAQINNIVRAPESGGDVGAEVYQARVGVDGTDYPTLKARLDAEIGSNESTSDRLGTEITENSNRITTVDTVLSYLSDFTVSYPDFALGTPAQVSNTRMHTTAPVLISKGTKIAARNGFEFALYDGTTVSLIWHTAWTATDSVVRTIAIRAADDRDLSSIYSTATLNQYVTADTILGTASIDDYGYSENRADVNKLQSDSEYIFSQYSIRYTAFVLGNAASSASQTAINRMTLNTRPTLKSGTRLQARYGFEFAVYNSGPILLTDGWVKKYQVQSDIAGSYIVVRKADDTTLEDIYSTAKITDVLTSNALIGIDITRQSRFVEKAYQMTTWYRTQLAWSPTPDVHASTTRLSNISSFDHPNNLHPGDVVKIELINSADYQYTFSMLSGSTRVQDFWAWRTDATRVTVTQDCYLAITLAKADTTAQIDLTDASQIRVTIIPQNSGSDADIAIKNLEFELNQLMPNRQLKAAKFCLGNRVLQIKTDANAGDPTRITLIKPITIPAGSNISAKPGYELGLYSTEAPYDLFTPWTTSYTAVGTVSAWVCVRFVESASFADIWRNLTFDDVLTSTGDIGMVVDDDNPFLLKPLSVTWYPNQISYDPANTHTFRVVENVTDRISNQPSAFNFTQNSFIKPGDIIDIKLLASGYQYAYALVDRNQLVQGTWTYSSTNKTIIAKQECYLLVMVKKSDSSTITPADGSNISVTIRPRLTTKQYHKTAVFVGDSITYGTGTTEGERYWDFLAAMLNIEAVGQGVAGSCYSVTSNYGTTNSPISQRWNNIPEKDLICIFAGTNDYGHNTPLGTIADSTDISFYGALNVIVSGLMNKYPKSRLVLMTPLHRYNFGGLTYDYDVNGVGLTLKDYVDAIKSIGQRYGVPVIDAFSIIGINPAISGMKTAFFPDGLHPNADGHALLAERVVDYFNCL